MMTKPTPKKVTPASEARYQTEVLGEALYNRHKEHLERDHIDEVVALDIDNRKVVSVGKTMKEALDLALAQGGKGRLVLRRVGPKRAFRIG